MCLDNVDLEIDSRVTDSKCKFYKEIERRDCDDYLYSMFSYLLKSHFRNRYNNLTLKFLPGVWYSLEDNALMNRLNDLTSMSENVIYPRGFHSFYNDKILDKSYRSCRYNDTWREIWEVEVKNIICTGEQLICGTFYFENIDVVVSRSVKFVKCVANNKGD